MRLEFDTSHQELLDRRLNLWRIRGFFNVGLLRFVERGILEREFRHQWYGFDPAAPTFTESLGISKNIPWLNYFFLDKKLLETIASMTRTGPLQSASLRVYRFDAGEGGEFKWHNDLVTGRRIGFAVNLSAHPYEGGEFMLRRSDDHSISATVQNTGYGDAIFFPIAEQLEHRVLPLKGTTPRITCAGWFFDQRIESSVGRRPQESHDP